MVVYCVLNSGLETGHVIMNGASYDFCLHGVNLYKGD